MSLLRDLHNDTAVEERPSSSRPFGYSFRHRIGDRALAWLLALLLCFTMLPMGALASTDSPTEATHDGPSAMNDDATRIESDDEQISEPESDRSQEDAIDPPAPTPEDEGTEENLSSDAPQIVENETDAQEGSAAPPQQSTNRTTVQPFTSLLNDAWSDKTTLDEDSYVLIQDSGETICPHVYTQAEPIAVGTTLYANIYRREGIFPGCRIPDQSRWSYQWLACDERKADDGAFAPIPGQTSKSLTITDALARELSGKYIRVKVIGDGQELFGPSGPLSRPSSYAFNTPGPVQAPDRITIDQVTLAHNSDEFGGALEGFPDVNIGDTLRIAAFNSERPEVLYHDDLIDFAWQIAQSEDGPFTTVATGGSYTVGDHAGMYLRVVATVRDGIPDSDQCITRAGRIIQPVFALSEVRLPDAPSLTQTRSELTARAYKSDHRSTIPMDEGVTFTWKWSDEQPGSQGEAAWHEIPGVSGNTFIVPDEFEGLWVSVDAHADGITVSSSDHAGPFTLPSEGDQPIDPDAALLSASVTVTGTTRHQPGSSYFYANWVPSTQFTWPEGKRVTAWEAFAELLIERDYSYDIKGGFPYSITSPDGYTLATSAEDPRSYWAFFVNGNRVDTLSFSYVLQDGDSVELRYIDATSSLGNEAVVTYPEETTPETPVVWGGSGTGAATSLVTPTTDLSTGWTFDLSEGKQDAGWSEPLIVNDRIYLASATRFCVLDRATGELMGSTPLAGSIDQAGCRPIYAKGKVIVPLANGQFQAFSASTMHCIWVSEPMGDPLPKRTIAPSKLRFARAAVTAASSTSDPVVPASAQQPTSSLYAHDGCLYVTTTAADADNGWFACLDMENGTRRWVRESENPDSSWSGAAQLNDYILVGSSDGKIEAISTASADGTAASMLQFEDSQGMSSSVVVHDDNAYCVTNDGVLHKMSVSADGALSEVSRTTFAASSASTPTICDDVAYVGGAAADGSGVLACIDTNTMTCSAITSAGSTTLPAAVKSAPLVSRQPAGTFVYFTCDSRPSGIYLYRAGDSTAQTLYDPAEGSGSCTGSIVPGPDGCLYFVDDSGRLIELRENVAASVPEPTPDPSTTDTLLDQMMEAQREARTPLEEASFRASQPSERTESAALTSRSMTTIQGTDDASAAQEDPIRRISSLIIDDSMHARALTIADWLLFAWAGLALGGVTLLIAFLVFRAVQRGRRA